MLISTNVFDFKVTLHLQLQQEKKHTRRKKKDNLNHLKSKHNPDSEEE